MAPPDHPPRIVYCSCGQESPLETVFERDEAGVIERHLDTLYSRHPVLTTGDYHIVFVWALRGAPMTDVWIVDRTWALQGSGLLIRECHTFAGMAPDRKEGIGSTVTVKALYAELVLIERFGNEVAEYLQAERISSRITLGLILDESFARNT